MNHLPDILGVNERNLKLIYEHNPTQHYPKADDKLLTKEILQAANIPAPKLLYSYRYFFELDSLIEDLWGRGDFVIKPARGRGGGGILVCDRFQNGQWFTTSGRPYSAAKMLDHAIEILHGVYSLDNTDDAVMIEEKIQLHECMDKVTYQGIPDIRVVVFQQIPIMAMLRIPTKCSEGRANLHAGGIGIGIDLETGVTTSARIKQRIIKTHPDTGAKLLGIKIPHWGTILNIAQSIQNDIPMGYMGIDFVIDERYGPQILECNVRPGLEIQNVNDQGLKKILSEM